MSGALTRSLTFTHEACSPKWSGRMSKGTSTKRTIMPSRFNEVFDLARTEGPQLNTRRGKDGVVMMAVEQFDQLSGRSRRKAWCIFSGIALVGLELDLAQDQDAGTDVTVA